MLDPSRLLRLVSSKTATGICVAALATGAGSVGVMAAVGGSGPTLQATSGTTTSTSTSASSHSASSKSESDEHETETSQTESSETHRRDTETETSETETESSETGDHDEHGDAVRQGVIDCRAAAGKAGKHGIGHCVSPIAGSNDRGHDD
jgi:cytoskeletal protein RodZ